MAQVRGRTGHARSPRQTLMAQLCSEETGSPQIVHGGDEPPTFRGESEMPWPWVGKTRGGLCPYHRGSTGLIPVLVPGDSGRKLGPQRIRDGMLAGRRFGYPFQQHPRDETGHAANAQAGMPATSDARAPSRPVTSPCTAAAVNTPRRRAWKRLHRVVHFSVGDCLSITTF